MTVVRHQSEAFKEGYKTGRKWTAAYRPGGPGPSRERCTPEELKRAGLLLPHWAGNTPLIMTGMALYFPWGDG